MSSESPDVVIYDSAGTELSVQNSTIIPSGTPAILSAGSDGTNSRFISVDGYGHVVVVGSGAAGSPSTGVLTIQGITSGTAVAISGTVTSNQGSPNTLANAWTTEITDGTNGAVAVKPANTAPIATDPALVVTMSPNSNLPSITDGTTSLGVVTAISATITNGITNLNVIDSSTQNRLDLLYARIDDLVNLLTENNKLQAQRSFISSHSAFIAKTTSVTMLNINNTRTGAIFVNDSGSNNNLYLLFMSNAPTVITTTNYSVTISPGGYLEVPFGFSGRIDGIWDGTSGNAYVTEISNSDI